jgi:lipid-binding SYLF domain-containing protein
MSRGKPPRAWVLWFVPALLLAALALGPALPRPAPAASASQLASEGRAALSKLTKSNSAAKLLAGKAQGILVFPHMMKAGFMFGGQIGEGVMFKGGKTAGYYNSVAASYGLQAGAQRFGYALFFMNDQALAYLDKSGGFEVGVGPSIVVVDEGMGKAMTSTTLTKDVYAFIFDQEGLMAGLGIQGSKITRISK